MTYFSDEKYCPPKPERHPQKRKAQSDTAQDCHLKCPQKEPLPANSVSDTRKIPITSNQTTIYRALEALTSTEVVKKIDFGDTGARYELNVGTNHHHHIVCKQCGKIEDIENCSSDELEKLVLKKSKSFTSIQNHALEFFGVCTKCS